MKSEECLWGHSEASLDVWVVALFSWNYPSPSECTIDMNGYRLSNKMLAYSSSIRIVTRRIGGFISSKLHMIHTIPEASTDWTFLFWHVESMESWGHHHTGAHPSAQCNRKRVTSYQGKCLQLSNVQWKCWQSHASCKVLCHAVNNGRRRGQRLKSPYQSFFVELFVEGHFWYPSIEIYRNCYRSILFAYFLSVDYGPALSRYFSGCTSVRDSMFYEYQIFPVYTRELIMRENANCFVTSVMLCSISHAPTITPRLPDNVSL